MSTTSDNRNCPYCLSPIEQAEDKVRCPKCGVTHHTDCWRANGKCSVYGCDGWALWSDGISGRITPGTDDRVDIEQAQTSTAAERLQDRCIECGKPVRTGALMCLKCRTQKKGYFFENCSGPAALAAIVVCATLALAIKVLM